MPVKINSVFTPLTYDQISKPLIEATQAQMAIEDAYVEANDKAAQLMAKANQQTDPIAYNRLKNYADDLKYQADQLANQGLQSSSRRALLDMKRRYGSEITPIEQAATRRQELSEEWRKMKLQNPDLIAQYDIDTMSLDTFVQNPNATYGDVINGEDLRKRAAAIISAFGQTRSEIKMVKNVDKWHKELQQINGLTPEQILAALDPNNNDALPELRSALFDLYNSTGVGNWNNQGASDKVMSYIREGAMLGLGSVKSSVVEDKDYARRAELSDYKSKLKYEKEIEDGDQSTGETSIDTNGTTWSEARGLEVNGTKEQVFVTRDSNGNLVYSVRGEKDKSGKYPHTIIDANQVVQKPSKPTSENVDMYDHPIRVTMGNTEGWGVFGTGWGADDEDVNAGNVEHLNSTDNLSGKGVTWGELSPFEKKEVEKIIGAGNQFHYSFLRENENNLIRSSNRNIIIVPTNKSVKTTVQASEGNQY